MIASSIAHAVFQGIFVCTLPCLSRWYGHGCEKIFFCGHVITRRCSCSRGTKTSSSLRRVLDSKTTWSTVTMLPAWFPQTECSKSAFLLKAKICQNLWVDAKYCSALRSINYSYELLLCKADRQKKDPKKHLSDFRANLLTLIDILFFLSLTCERQKGWHPSQSLPEVLAVTSETAALIPILLLLLAHKNSKLKCSSKRQH